MTFKIGELYKAPEWWARKDRSRVIKIISVTPLVEFPNNNKIEYIYLQQGKIHKDSFIDWSLLSWEMTKL